MAEGDVTNATQSPLPPGILQQLMGMMGGGTPQQTPVQPQQPQNQSVLPQTSPVQPQAEGLSDYAQLAATQQKQLLGSAPAQEEAAARQRMGELAGQAASMPIPKTGWMDTQGQPQNGNIFHTLGRALMAIGGATLPGREIQAQQYGPGIRRYGGQQAAIAEQIKTAQEQAAGAQSELGTLGQVAGRTIMGGAQVQKSELSSEAFKQRTEMMANKVASNHQDNLARIAAMKDINAKNNAAKIEARQMLDDTMTEIAGNKNLTAEEIQGMRSATLESLLNTKGAQDPSIKAAIMDAFGIPTATVPSGQTPQMQSPTPANAPKKPVKPKAGGTQFHYDSQGNHVAGP